MGSSITRECPGSVMIISDWILWVDNNRQQRRQVTTEQNSTTIERDQELKLLPKQNYQQWLLEVVVVTAEVEEAAARV